MEGCNKLVEAVKDVGPIPVAVDASNWSKYSSGIFSDCGNSLNHGVLVVGVTN